MTEQLTDEEYMKLSYGDSLKYLIKRAEERVQEWKRMLGDCHKAGIEDEEYKDILRYGKNLDEKILKELREEITYFNQGLNPPYCYPDYRRNKEQEQSVNKENK